MPASRPTGPASLCPWCSMARWSPSSPSTSCSAEVEEGRRGSERNPGSLLHSFAMPRPLRPIDDDLIYHVINRGNNRAPVFFGDEDYEAFRESLADLKRRRPFAFYGYCLMPNHVHLLIRPLETPISRLMQSLLVSHTQRYHRCHHSGGHVWQGRFKSPVIQDDDQLLTVLRYIEANPLRARMLGSAGDHRWSSFPAHGLGHPDPHLDPLTAHESL